jgi:hypothetical protein
MLQLCFLDDGEREAGITEESIVIPTDQWTVTREPNDALLVCR